MCTRPFIYVTWQNWRRRLWYQLRGKFELVISCYRWMRRPFRAIINRHSYKARPTVAARLQLMLCVWQADVIVSRLLQGSQTRSRVGRCSLSVATPGSAPPALLTFTPFWAFQLPPRAHPSDSLIHLRGLWQRSKPAFCWQIFGFPDISYPNLSVCPVVSNPDHNPNPNTLTLIPIILTLTLTVTLTWDT